ncbi:MAG TPA: galactose-1-phosphate uridylyltransferase [Acidimicrobiia bacterium]|nr:galactose-1-phosphate uridylyltransferase [Acidimicrobiia bacterium]
MGDGSSEQRLDVLTGDWVAISGHRQGRPNLPSTACPFCVGGVEAPEPYDVRVFENRWPALAPGARLQIDGDTTTTPARGAAEVVLYTPDHEASMASLGEVGVRKVIDVWAQRTAALLERDEIEYVLIFENRGRDVGATIDHPHGQIYAFASIPPVPARELAVAAERGCPLCTDVTREADAATRVVHDGDAWLGWVPFASPWPYGLALAPRAHVDGLPALDDAARDGLARALVDVLGRYDALFDAAAAPFPYMLWVHQSPGDADAHLHVHLAPPWRSPGVPRYVAAGELGSGMYFNPIAPEDAASALRAAGGAPGERKA